METARRARVDPLSSTLSDEEIVARVSAGQVDLFEVLMRRHNQRVFRAARAIVRDDAEAEDVMQEAYVRAYAQLGQFEGRAQWSTWVTRIAVNEALGRLRRGGRFVHTDLDREQEAKVDRSDEAWRNANGGSAPFPVGPEDQAAARELGGFLEHAMDSLPDIYRTVFVLREVEEMSTAEAATTLDISEELVKVRLHRARAALRQRLDERVGSALRGVYDFHLTRCDRVVAAVMARIGPRR
ncbi:MAG TPA: RNA polymerase sigma factor [Polyangia bacterium]|jgi:RNA polymerase sigma-70 factor (ECF subfamily)|nr:RNA polymerase sigma factor [Polyangia bacterium]